MMQTSITVFIALLAASGLMALLGVALIVRGWRGVRIGNSPHCRKCSYDLTGNTSGVCPECGSQLDQTKAVVRGLPKRRPISVVVGLLVFTFFGSLFAWQSWELAGRANWYRWKPDSWVIADLDSKNSTTQRRALGELTHRAAADELEPDELRRLGDKLLAIQATYGTWGPVSRDAVALLSTMKGSQLLTEEQRALYTAQVAQVSDIRMKRPVVAGTSIVARCRLNLAAYSGANLRGPNRSMWAPRVSVRIEYRYGADPWRLAQPDIPALYRETGLMVSDIDIVLPPPEPTAATLDLRVTLAVSASDVPLNAADETARWPAVDVIEHETVTEHTFSLDPVVAPAEPRHWLVTRPDIDAQMTRSLVFRQPYIDQGNAPPGDLLVRAFVDVMNAPLSLAHRLELVDSSGTAIPGRIIENEPLVANSLVMQRVPIVLAVSEDHAAQLLNLEKCGVRLTPDLSLAETLWDEEIWGGEIILRPGQGVEARH